MTDRKPFSTVPLTAGKGNQAANREVRTSNTSTVSKLSKLRAPTTIKISKIAKIKPSSENATSAKSNIRTRSQSRPPVHKFKSSTRSKVSTIRSSSRNPVKKTVSKQGKPRVTRKKASYQSSTWSAKSFKKGTSTDTSRKPVGRKKWSKTGRSTREGKQKKSKESKKEEHGLDSIDGLKNFIDRLLAKLNQKTSECKQLKGELQEVEKQVAAKVIQEQLEEKLAVALAKSAETEKSFTELQETHKQAVENSATLERTLSDLRSQQLSLQSEHDELTCRAKDLQQSLEDFQKKYKQANVDIKQLSDEKAALELERDEQKAKIVQLRTEAAHQETMRRRLHNQIHELKGNIRVFVRVRPANPNGNGESPAILPITYPPNTDRMALNIKEITTGVGGEKERFHDFKFDRVFSPWEDQDAVFKEVSNTIQSALDGYRVCIFAYGQTGSGKTHTLLGASNNPSDPRRGITPRAVHLLYKQMDNLKEKGWKFECRVSILEVYNEKIRDLLPEKMHNGEGSGKAIKPLIPASPVTTRRKRNTPETPGSTRKTRGAPGSAKKMKGGDGYPIRMMRRGRTTHTVVEGLMEHRASSPKEIDLLLERAFATRAVGSTGSNDKSSRSHLCFKIEIMANNVLTGETIESSVSLVDLAGSERLKESKAEGMRREETKHINKSLSTLKTVIGSLARKDKHVPYRDSKLTHLLQDSFGGNCKTLMIVALSPQDNHVNESLSSLRFANRVHSCRTNHGNGRR